MQTWLNQGRNNIHLLCTYQYGSFYIVNYQTDGTMA